MLAILVGMTLGKLSKSIDLIPSGGGPIPDDRGVCYLNGYLKSGVTGKDACLGLARGEDDLVIFQVKWNSGNRGQVPDQYCWREVSDGLL